MTDNSPLTFGRTLQAKRLELGLRLQDVAERTRVSLPMLEHIEAEEHQELPAETFVKGFVRSYARAVGLPVEPLVEAYRLSVQQHRDDNRHAAMRLRARQRRRPRLLLLLTSCLLMAGLVALLIWRLQLISLAPPQAAAPAAVKAPPPAPVPETPPAPAPPPPAPVVAKAFHLSIQTIAETRLKVMIDRKESRDVNLRPGDHLEFEASSGFSLLLANPAAVQLTLNGQAVKIPTAGKSGQAVTLQLP
jgi:cytoskeletal protein RodZ